MCKEAASGMGGPHHLKEQGHAVRRTAGENKGKPIFLRIVPVPQLPHLSFVRLLSLPKSDNQWHRALVSVNYTC